MAIILTSVHVKDKAVAIIVYYKLRKYRYNLHYNYVPVNSFYKSLAHDSFPAITDPDVLCC